MAILVNEAETRLTVTVIDGDVARFKQLISRGMNTWNDAPPSMKALHDLVVLGKIQQDYYQPNQGNPKPNG